MEAMLRRAIGTLAALAMVAAVLAGCSAAGSIPPGFPADVPLYDGKIDKIQDLTVSGHTTWHAFVFVPGLDTIDEITAQLEGAGYQIDSIAYEVPQTTDDGSTVLGTMAQYSGPHDLSVVISPDDREAGFLAWYSFRD